MENDYKAVFSVIFHTFMVILVQRTEKTMRKLRLKKFIKKKKYPNGLEIIYVALHNIKIT